ncbi:hypothetical protein [Bifidobacterium leontopitheci]|uniref:hypothetical protein n=1 Tax=Bifidobacterium leontopitheci TaxID=2650774 RepID=UPI0012640269|nr:hypothetical protein [Bifidobacterium leontopitheci]
MWRFDGWPIGQGDGCCRSSAATASALAGVFGQRGATFAGDGQRIGPQRPFPTNIGHHVLGQRPAQRPTAGVPDRDRDLQDVLAPRLIGPQRTFPTSTVVILAENTRKQRYQRPFPTSTNIMLTGNDRPSGPQRAFPTNIGRLAVTNTLKQPYQRPFPTSTMFSGNDPPMGV